MAFATGEHVATPILQTVISASTNPSNTRFTNPSEVPLLCRSVLRKGSRWTRISFCRGGSTPCRSKRSEKGPNGVRWGQFNSVYEGLFPTRVQLGLVMWSFS